MHIDERVELVGELIRAAFLLGQTYNGPTAVRNLAQVEKLARAAARAGDLSRLDRGDYEAAVPRLADAARDLLALMVPATRVEDDTRLVMEVLDDPA